MADLQKTGAEEQIKSLFVKIRFADFSRTTVERAGLPLKIESFLELLRVGLQRKQLGVRLLGLGVRFNEEPPREAPRNWNCSNRCPGGAWERGAPPADHATSGRSPKKQNIILIVIVNMESIVNIMNIDSFLYDGRETFHARKWILLTVFHAAIGCLTANAAGDVRFGFATHFEQGWAPTTVMKAIAATGVSYIRDGLNAGSWETSPGVHALPPWDMGWLNPAQADGLKVVAVLHPNPNYSDQYNPVAMSNLAVSIAKAGLVAAFEITNEPNNAYASYE